MHQKIDYKEIGFKCGLEVHQQLLTATKMFCRCPAGLYTSEHDGAVVRHMRPTLSELGEYDGTALMEFKTKKNIIYLLNEANVCTYEMDDTPPFLVNQQALDIAIEQCLMLGCDIIDEVHIARKQYLDGSIPTGFQRTAIVGVNGKLPFRGRELSIIQVSMEEDSCREVTDRGHLILWRTDRLGMPLIETVTGPDLRSPDEVAEAILLVGRVCRSTRHVRTGIGASRQDINVSVTGGTRIEIKGVPKAGWAPALVHGEAVRQVNLLKLREELHRRGFKTRESVTMEHKDVTKFFIDSGYPALRLAEWERFTKDENRRPGFELGEGEFSVRAVKLPGMAGLFSWPTQPHRTFTKELTGRVRVIAGLDQAPVVLFGERWPDYDGSDRELHRLRQMLKCGDHDEFAIVWGPERDTITAAEEIRTRFQEATQGIPSETRQPFADGSTGFERILPGPDRMYPDTDSPPTKIERERVAGLRRALPCPPWEREQLYSAAGVPRSTIHFLIRRGGADLVDRVAAEAGGDLKRACFFFGEELKGLGREGVAVKTITPERWLEFFRLIKEHPLLWEARHEMTRALAASPNLGAHECASALGLFASAVKWQERVGRFAGMGLGMQDADTLQRRLRFTMGLAMHELRGRVAASDVAAELERTLEHSAL